MMAAWVVDAGWASRVVTLCCTDWNGSCTSLLTMLVVPADWVDSNVSME